MQRLAGESRVAAGVCAAEVVAVAVGKALAARAADVDGFDIVIVRIEVANKDTVGGTAPVEGDGLAGVAIAYYSRAALKFEVAAVEDEGTT